MNIDQCPKESSLLAALANDSMSDELAAHLSSCAICQDAKLVWSYLRDTARAEVQTDIAPAGILWWKAQLAKKRVEARRSIAVIDIMQKVALAAAIVIVAALAVWQAPNLFEMPSLLLAGSAAVLILFAVSVIVVFTLDRDSHRRPLPRGM